MKLKDLTIKLSVFTELTVYNNDLTVRRVGSHFTMFDDIGELEVELIKPKGENKLTIVLKE